MKRDSVQILLLFRELEIDKFHVLLAPEADVPDQGLKNGLTAAVTVMQLAGDVGVEDLCLLDSSREVQKLDQRVQVFDRIYA